MKAIRLWRRVQRGTSVAHQPNELELPRELRASPVKLSSLTSFRLGLIITVLLLIASYRPALSQDVVGSVTRLHGSVSGEIGGGADNLDVGTEIHMGDRVRTGDQAMVELTMSDDTKVTLGPSTEMMVDSYIYTPGVNGQGVLKVDGGVFHVEAGSIASFGGDALQIKMPGGTVAFVNTAVWGRVSTEQLTVVSLGTRSITVRNSAGTVVLSQQHTGTVVNPVTASPSQPSPLNNDDLQSVLSSVSWP